MNARNRKLAGLLLILLFILVLTFWMGRRVYRTPSPSAGGEQAPARTAFADDLPSVEIPELASQVEAAEDDVERNPFAYASRPAAPVVAPPPPPPPLAPAVEVARPSPPAPPPSVPFRYSGYGSIDPSSGNIKAVLFDEDNKPYPVSENEILMGRFRINRISEAFVDIEDLESGRNERLLIEIE